MRTLTRILTGALAAGTVAASAAMPAAAGPYDYGRFAQRDPVNECAAAATRTAQRYSREGRARVTDIRDVDRKSYGYKVEGRVAVDRRDWRYGWDGRDRDSGRFVCKVGYDGRIFDLNFSGIRGL